MLTLAAERTSQDATLPKLDRALRRVVLTGLTLVLLVPMARGQIPWLGWAPLWLVGMPLAAWWALHRFRLPRPLARTLRARQPARGRSLPADWARAA